MIVQAFEFLVNQAKKIDEEMNKISEEEKKK
jgi:hypothetical protein